MIKPLTGKAAQAVEQSTARFNIYEGAVRSSKTVASTLAWLRFVRNGPDGNLAMIGKTERTLKRNVIDPIVEMVGTRRARYLAGAGELHLFGRRIYVGGGNDAKAVEKIQGLTLAGIYGDEIATWPEELWDMAGTRLSVVDASLFGTCNPAGPAHYLKRGWLDQAGLWITHGGDVVRGGADALDVHRFSFILDDNPHLPAAFVASLKRQYTGVFFKRYIQGLWVPAEGAIFDCFDDKRHVVTDAQMPSIVRWLAVGVDYGTTNPFAALLLAVGADNRLYLVREWRHDSRAARRQMTDVEYSAALREWLATVDLPGGLTGVRPEWTVVDPSAASFRVQLHRDGLPSQKANNDVVDSIRTAASLFAKDLLLINDRCTGLLEEIPGYCWDARATLLGKDEPIKRNDHSIDAGLRYAIHTTRAAWLPMLRHSGLDLAA